MLIIGIVTQHTTKATKAPKSFGHIKAIPIIIAQEIPNNLYCLHKREGMPYIPSAKKLVIIANMRLISLLPVRFPISMFRASL